MILTGDYHTHTKYSHGKGLVIDNAKRAEKMGLKEIAITDHGFSHPAFGLRKRKLSSLRKDVDTAKEKCGITVLMGIESNLLSDKGDIDLKEKYYKDFDLLAVGIHKFVLYKPKGIFNIFLPNFFTDIFNGKPSKSLIKANTLAYTNAVKNHPIDFITHLNYCVYADAVEVAKVCADYGTFLELSGKKEHLSNDELYAISKTGVNFIVNSDAHSPNRIADVALVEKLVEEGVVKKEQIVNIDGRTPNFRFKNYKIKGI
ncbi:MAG: PHP domain-containing protein [Clostridiales bacterium]|nr:PHP domain-containing protein [Clostridiales bacterium]